MIVIEPIHQLPLHEMLLAVEAIRDDIFRTEVVLEIPHKQAVQ